MSDKQTKLVKNTLILSIANFFAKGITFVMAPFIARWLLSNEYGIYDLVLTYMSLFTPIVILDCGEAMFRFMLDETEERKKQVVTNSSLISLLGIILCVVVLIVVSIYTQDDIYLYILGLLIAQVLNNFFMMYMRGLKKLTDYAFSNIIYMIIMASLTCVFVFGFKYGLRGIISAHIIGYVGSIVFVSIKAPIFKWIRIKYFSLIEVKNILLYSLPLIPNAISWWIMSASDRTIVNLILGSSANGILAVAHKIPAICEIMYSMFHISWQESASEEIDKEDANVYFNTIFNNVIVLIGSICAVVLSCNYLFVYCFFGNEYIQAYKQVPILILAVFISAIGQFFGGINIARKNTKINGMTTTIGAILNVAIHLLLIGAVGLYAATVSTLISNLAVLFMRYAEIRRYFKFSLTLKAKISIIFIIIIFILQYVISTNIIVGLGEIFICGIIAVIININMILNVIRKVLKRV